jgi:diacylglycerol kinase family enzyme
MLVRLIANPNASGVQGALIDRVAARLARVGDVEVRLTERPGHATDLARAPGADVVVAMGGDGTANEVANGMPPEALMGLVPAGASSVFARQLRLPRQMLRGGRAGGRDRGAAVAHRRPRLGGRPHVHVLGRHGP